MSDRAHSKEMKSLLGLLEHDPEQERLLREIEEALAALRRIAGHE